MDIKTLIKEAHQTAVEKGWYEAPEKTLGEHIALWHSECSETLEEIRKGMEPNAVYYVGNSGKPEGVPIEIADVIIRIADFCGRFNIDLETALELKMDYNKSRPHRHGGKKL